MGGELYRPIGEEWFTRGYWKMAEIYNNHPATVAQYLGINETHRPAGDGLYLVTDPGHNFDQRAITLDYFMAHDFDIVLATIPMHLDSFARLANDHPNRPKTIYQIGNQWNIGINSPIKNILASARLLTKPAGFNIIEYHQEFNLDIFHPGYPYQDCDTTLTQSEPAPVIRSFVNCFNTASIYQYDWLQFLEVEQALGSGWLVQSYGGSCRDGNANGEQEVADMMRESRFIWHVKYDGDGYGHVIHNAAAIARPAIVKLAYYRGKLAGDLMIDGLTCIGIDGLSVDEIVNKINYYSDSERYRKMASATYQNFKQIVDFDGEARAISNFVENLI